MGKRVYISADYSEYDGDREVINVLHAWGKDNIHMVDYVDTAQVVSGSVSKNSDCRICDLKKEFNEQINVSSAVIFVIGDKTASRTAGSACQRRNGSWFNCVCTPYKQNKNGTKPCKVFSIKWEDEDISPINSYSYIMHEFMQAEKRRKKIIVVYNSFYRQPSWLPSYMSRYKDVAEPFWVRDAWGNKKGNYGFIKRALGYE